MRVNCLDKNHAVYVGWLQAGWITSVGADVEKAVCLIMQKARTGWPSDEKKVKQIVWLRFLGYFCVWIRKTNQK